MLKITGLECVRGNRTLFRNVSFAVRPGECFRLTGPNGSGKTTLLRTLCGLLTPASGRISWKGENIHMLAENYYSSMTYIGHRHGVKDEFTAVENLRVSCGLNGIDVDRRSASDALARMGLSGRENLPARFLSEGERKRTALARLLVCRTSLWLLDEVLTSLDHNAVDCIHALIEEHLDRGGMAIVATHQDLNLSAFRLQHIELAA